MLGGGRYDGLVSDLGGSDVCGIGFASGIERLLLLMENTGVEIEDDTKVKIYFAPMGEEAEEVAFSICNKVRALGISAELDHMKRGIKAQFKYADKIKAEYVAVLGSNEIQNNQIKVKKMATGEEVLLSLDNFTNEFLSLIK